MLSNAIAALESLLPVLSVDEAAVLAEIGDGRLSVSRAQHHLDAYRTTPELGAAVEGVIEAMEPYEALLGMEQACRAAKTVQAFGAAPATRDGAKADLAKAQAELYAAIEELDLDHLREYGHYRKGVKG